MVFVVGSVKSASSWPSIQSDRECPTVINPHPESDNSYYRTTFTIDRGQSSREEEEEEEKASSSITKRPTTSRLLDRLTQTS